MSDVGNKSDAPSWIRCFKGMGLQVRDCGLLLGQKNFDWEKCRQSWTVDDGWFGDRAVRTARQYIEAMSKYSSDCGGLAGLTLGKASGSEDSD